MNMWEKWKKKKELDMPAKKRPRSKTDFEVECEILTMNIQSKFYRENLFLCFANTDWVGEIKRIGDTIRIGEEGILLTIDKQVMLSCKREEDLKSLDSVATDMSLKLKTEIESEIIRKRNELQSKDVYRCIDKLYFASQVIMASGLKSRDEAFYDFVFLYVFMWEESCPKKD